jgi:hypothetical protein
VADDNSEDGGEDGGGDCEQDAAPPGAGVIARLARDHRTGMGRRSLDPDHGVKNTTALPNVPAPAGRMSAT